MSKKISQNDMDSSEREIAIYTTQNEIMVVVVELFKRGRFFWDN